jgi:hypothetical protein
MHIGLLTLTNAQAPANENLVSYVNQHQFEIGSCCHYGISHQSCSAHYHYNSLTRNGQTFSETFSQVFSAYTATHSRGHRLDYLSVSPSHT